MEDIEEFLEMRKGARGVIVKSDKNKESLQEMERKKIKGTRRRYFKDKK